MNEITNLMGPWAIVALSTIMSEVIAHRHELDRHRRMSMAFTWLFLTAVSMAFFHFAIPQAVAYVSLWSFILAILKIIVVEVDKYQARKKLEAYAEVRKQWDNRTK